MRRRDALRSLGTLTVGLTAAGCLGVPESNMDTPGATRTAPTGATPTDGSARTTRGTARAECSTVETAFVVPDVAKPDPLTAEAAEMVVARVESQYEEWISEAVGPDDFEGVPTDVDSFSYFLRRGGTEPIDGGYRVFVEARASYSFDGVETTETPLTVDRPVDFATYEVTDRRIERLDGVGDLTGTVVCWQ